MDPIRELAAARKLRNARIAGLLTIAAAAVAAGVLVASNLGALTSAPVPANSGLAATSPLPTASVSPTTTASASPTPTPLNTFTGATSQAQGNVRTSTVFKGSNAKVQFSLPSGWTAKEVKAGTPDFPAWAIDVADESGRKVAQLYYGSGGGLGGACGPDEHFKVTELDTAQSALNGPWTQASAVRFSYRVLDQTSLGKGLSYEVGLVDKSSGQLVDTCPNLMYAIVTGAPKGSLSFADRATQGPGAPTFATMSEAISYMSTPEYAKLKEMITSLQLTQ